MYVCRWATWQPCCDVGINQSLNTIDLYPIDYSIHATFLSRHSLMIHNPVQNPLSNIILMRYKLSKLSCQRVKKINKIDLIIGRRKYVQKTCL